LPAQKTMPIMLWVCAALFSFLDCFLGNTRRQLHVFIETEAACSDDTQWARCTLFKRCSILAQSHPLLMNVDYELFAKPAEYHVPNLPTALDISSYGFFIFDDPAPKSKGTCETNEELHRRWRAIWSDRSRTLQ
jgi:hypothetical protein